jgi:acyl carrier protein
VIDVLETVSDSLVQTLQLAPDRLSADRDLRLLGSIPEFDSMAVLAVLTDLEDRLDIEFDDDEISAEIFETLGALSDFVESKIAGS